VRWSLAQDPGPLPHLFRVLWTFWFLRDHMREGGSWVTQLLPAADLLDPQARVELAWTALVTALDVGDDEAALAASQRLGSLLPGIETPFLRALELSVAARSTASVTLCLAAYARLATAEGDPGRAALLAGAAEGLRRRAGLRLWPTLRPAEAELVTEVRQMLGAERFDQAFSSGSGLSQREAVTAARSPRGTDAS